MWPSVSRGGLRHEPTEVTAMVSQQVHFAFWVMQSIEQFFLICL